MIGQTLGRYRIEAQLGTGGMGVVYRAHDTELRRDVALKVLSDTEHARERLLHEARAASALNHPNVCTVHEVGRSDAGQAFIVMEYIEGGSFRELIPPDGLPPAAVVKYGVQIADALAHAHAHGIVHRDLKSANVLVAADGRVKVLDFGIAGRLAAAESNFATESRASGGDLESVSGTLAYMAPETLHGEPADERSDIWALGVLLYEAATGALPFGGRTAFDLSAAILRESPAPAPARVPASLRSIVDRSLAKNPRERYQHASEVRAALDAFSAGAIPAIDWKAARSSHRWWLAAAACALVTIAAAGMALTGRWHIGSADIRVSTGAPASASAEANEYLEKGLLFLSKQFDLARARDMLEHALQIDPHFAEARAHYAFTHLLMIDGGYSNDTNWLYKAETELHRALDDDRGNGRAHSTLAAIHIYKGRKDLVPGEVTKALQANPRT
jgi:predicted Ser/Thr protein kinase